MFEFGDKVYVMTRKGPEVAFFVAEISDGQYKVQLRTFGLDLADPKDVYRTAAELADAIIARLKQEHEACLANLISWLDSQGDWQLDLRDKTGLTALKAWLDSQGDPRFVKQMVTVSDEVRESVEQLKGWLWLPGHDLPTQ